MVKPSIRKRDGSWTVTRPGYGFNQTPIVEQFDSHKAALASLRSAPASAGAQVAKGDYTYDLHNKGWHAYRGTIRLEDT